MALRDLRPLGPLGMLDRALDLVRTSPRDVLLRAWLGGALVAGTVVGIYYVERVEGVSALRLPWAVGLALAWWGRALCLGRAARDVTSRLWDATPPPHAGRPSDVLRTSMAVGLGMWLWCWLIALGTLAGPVGVVLVLPLLALRGATAPSWIARSSCEGDAGWRALLRAAADCAGRRGSGIAIEAMVLFGALGLAVNLYAAIALLVLLLRSFLGLEVATVETFLSPGNTFVLLCVLATSLVALEPLRAAISALFYADARVRGEGLDLRASIEDAIAHTSRGRTRDASRAAAAIALLVVVTASPAPAQPPPAFPPPPMAGDDPAAIEDGIEAALALPGDPGPMPAVALTAADRAVEDEVEAILARAEFAEHADHRGESLQRLFERLLEWLLRSRPELPEISAPRFGDFGLPGPTFWLVTGLVLILAVGAYLWLTRRKDAGLAHAAAAHGAVDPRDRPPSWFLDDAARLAGEGDLREALRSIYLATLVALDRRRVIAFDPHRTNWQYLRQMPRGAERDAFRELTRTFDHKWYGREPTSRPDYERCRALADAILAEPERAP